MMAELRNNTAVELRVRRPFVMNVSVNRAGASVGCGITYDASTGVSLVIETIADGCIKNWNIAHPDRIVKQGDRVISVNGQVGRAPQLLDFIKGSDALQLIIVRPAELPMELP